MKRAVRLVSGARALQRNVRAYEIDDIGRRQYLLRGCKTAALGIRREQVEPAPDDHLSLVGLAPVRTDCWRQNHCIEHGFDWFTDHGLQRVTRDWQTKTRHRCELA